MAQTSITSKPEYLNYFKFIMDKNRFSSKEFQESFQKKSKTFIKNLHYPFKKSNKLSSHDLEVRKLNKKLQLLQKEGLIIKKDILSNKVKGSKGGRSGLYEDNAFEFFLSKYILPNFEKELKVEHKQILLFLFSKEISELLNFSKIKNKQDYLDEAYLKNLEFKTIDELFSKIFFHISSYLTYKGLEHFNYKLI